MFDLLDFFLLLLLAVLFAFPVVQNIYRAWAEPAENDEETNLG